MRTAFIDTVTALAERDERVWLLTGDLGFSVFEGFKERFPERYLNVGVAEQDLMGIAAGLAMVGLRPFVYSITTFATMRAYEQIRHDIGYQHLPVIIVGGGSTFSYSTFGATHMPLEDYAIMRAIPGMAVLSPGDPVEVREILLQAHERGAPAYMRIAKKGEPIVQTNPSSIRLGEPSIIRDGTDAVLFVTGRQLPNACMVAEQLLSEGISVKVVSIHSIKPLNEEAVVEHCVNTKAVIIVEEHSTIGGLGEAIATILLRKGISKPFAQIGITDEFPKGVYSQDVFLDVYGLSPEKIGDVVRRLLKA